MTSDTQKKQCSKCGNTKPIAEFEVTGNTYCLDCMRIYLRAYRQANKQRLLEYQRAYQRKYYSKNFDKNSD